MEVVGACRQALRHKGQEPGQTDPHGAAHPAQGEALAPQAFHQRALRTRNDAVCGVRHKLTATNFAVMILLPMAVMTMLLEPYRSTPRARVTDTHGCWHPKVGGRNCPTIAWNG